MIISRSFYSFGYNRPEISDFRTTDIFWGFKITQNITAPLFMQIIILPIEGSRVVKNKHLDEYDSRFGHHLMSNCAEVCTAEFLLLNSILNSSYFLMCLTLNSLLNK